MEDYLTEKEQWEALKTWVKENGLWIIAGVAVGALALAGYRWWDARADRLAAEASGKYDQILEAFNRGDKTRAKTLIDELQRDHPKSPYTDQAYLADARAAVQSGDLPAAAQRLKAVMDQPRDRELALIARLRMARLQIAQNKYDEAITTLNGVEAGAFEPRYHEVRGDALYAKGDKPAALKEYQAARDKGGTTGAVDAELLDLKINDLESEGMAVPQAATPPSNANNVAK